VVSVTAGLKEGSGVAWVYEILVALSSSSLTCVGRQKFDPEQLKSQAA